MRSTHHRATRVTNEDRQAIRHQDAARYTALARAGPIGRQVDLGILDQFDDFRAMHLVEIHRAHRRQAFLQLPPIPQHINCFITDM